MKEWKAIGDWEENYSVLGHAWPSKWIEQTLYRANWMPGVHVIEEVCVAYDEVMKKHYILTIEDAKNWAFAHLDRDDYFDYFGNN